MPPKRAKHSKKDTDVSFKEESQGAHSVSSTEALLLQMLELMQEKEDKRAVEEEERRIQEEERRIQEERRRKQEEDRRKEDEDRRFQALLQAFSQHTLPSQPANSYQQTSNPPTVTTSSQQKRPTTSMPSKLLPDATFTSFKHWKRGWEDFSLT